MMLLLLVDCMPPLVALSDTAQHKSSTLVQASSKVDDELKASNFSFNDPATSAKFKKKKVKPVVPLSNKRPTSTPKTRRPAVMSMDENGDQENSTLKNILDNEEMWH